MKTKLPLKNDESVTRCADDVGSVEFGNLLLPVGLLFELLALGDGGLSFQAALLQQLEQFFSSCLVGLAALPQGLVILHANSYKKQPLRVMNRSLI